ncbi:hypothetical protein ALI22I_45655 [Saccharothrix sp. ALI-22-I]|uniref:hypothetical protein n=1 Tax=Saccharothrix sp. ALI-22-I TaxID=1933778 RepID=UPI00097C8193|nr:hypothetical protein [Saccharothrix sp. ALI-22-I]ONI80565.1 hypothetical protein ALI22I_45655 [Saccharothrix sp. ALI-22-I]
MGRARVQLWAQIPSDVWINYEVEPGGGAVVFKIGQDVELYVDPRALTKIGEAAAEAVELAGAVAADKVSSRSR